MESKLSDSKEETVGQYLEARIISKNEKIKLEKNEISRRFNMSYSNIRI